MCDSGHTHFEMKRTTTKARISLSLIVGISLLGLMSSSLTADASPIPRLSAQTETPFVVGTAITLPNQLYIDDPRAGYSLITPDQAQQVETTMWRLWETELVRSDTCASLS